MLFRINVALLSVLFVISVFLASLTVQASPIPFVRPGCVLFLAVICREQLTSMCLLTLASNFGIQRRTEDLGGARCTHPPRASWSFFV
jgi:hypothetical protein